MFSNYAPGRSVIYTSGKFADTQRRVPRSEFVAKPYKSADILEACRRLRTT